MASENACGGSALEDSLLLAHSVALSFIAPTRSLLHPVHIPLCLFSLLAVRPHLLLNQAENSPPHPPVALTLRCVFFQLPMVCEYYCSNGALLNVNHHYSHSCLCVCVKKVYWGETHMHYCCLPGASECVLLHMFKPPTQNH